MGRCYINGTGVASVQGEERSFDQFEPISENVTLVRKLNYKQFIPAGQIRRMSSAVKNGIFASNKALNEAGIEMPNAIISGTGLGCTIDSDRFLKKIVDDNEQYLTPTNFVQSTHNTVGGQIALGMKCKAYNMTYVHEANSFESALIDGMLMLDEGESNILVGGVDELAPYDIDLFKRMDLMKDSEEISIEDFNHPNTSGTAFSEGAQFFLINSEKNENSYAEIKGVKTFSKIQIDEVEKEISAFLNQQNINFKDIDVLVLGKNGDSRYEAYYKKLQDLASQEDIQQTYYKPYSGEYNTVNSFGMFIAASMIKNQMVPERYKLNNSNKSEIKNVLIYNQYNGKSHSFILLSDVKL